MITKLAKSFLSLPDNKKNVITGNILDAGLIMECSGDYRQFLRLCKSKALGKAKKIYDILSRLNDSEFDEFLKIIIE